MPEGADFRIHRSETVGHKPCQQIASVLGPFFAECALQIEKMSDLLRRLTAGQRAVVCAWIFNGEVLNGGLPAVFYNSTGEFADEIVKALNELGATEHAEIFRRTIALCPNSRMPTDIAERNHVLDELSESAKATLDSLDDEFLQLEHGGRGLIGYMVEYMDKHRGEFYK